MKFKAKISKRGKVSFGITIPKWIFKQLKLRPKSYVSVEVRKLK